MEYNKTEFEMLNADLRRMKNNKERKELIAFMDWVKQSTFSSTSSKTEDLVDIYLGIHQPSVTTIKPATDEMSLTTSGYVDKKP